MRLGRTFDVWRERERCELLSIFNTNIHCKERTRDWRAALCGFANPFSNRRFSAAGRGPQASMPPFGGKESRFLR